MPKIFLLISLFLLKINFIETSPCAKVYILPMFTETQKCEVKSLKGFEYNDCPYLISNFIEWCAKDLADLYREELVIMFADYSKITSCEIEVTGQCSSIPTTLNDIKLEPDRDYSIKTNFYNILADSKDECIDKSMAIFISNVPCSEFSKYPDVNEMFNEYLDEFVKELATEKYIHTAFVWISANPNDSKFQPCPNLINYDYKKKSGDYVSFIPMNVDYFYENGSKICHNIYHNSRPLPQNKSHTTTRGIVLITVGCSVVLALIILVIGFFMWRVRKRYFESKIEFFASQHRNLARQFFVHIQIPIDEWELTPKELKVDPVDILGSGVSANVYKGRLRKRRNGQLKEIDVAVKFAHVYSSQDVRLAMLEEIELMKRLGQHENLLTMIGYVKKIDNPVIASEFCVYGDLLKVLRRHPIHFMSNERCTNVEPCLILIDLLWIIKQVCSGLVYLSSLNFVHRDIAARNILLTHNLIAKIGDFGLCQERDVLSREQISTKLPIRNMPYESLKHGKFSEKSDAWSFGVLIWECFTGGKTPLILIETECLIDFLSDNSKLEFPKNVPPEIVQLVDDNCFKKNPEERANFVELEEKLEKFFEFPVI